MKPIEKEPLKNNILYLSYDGLTDTLGQSQILPYLLGLAQKGNTFTIISAEKKSEYALRKSLILEKIQNTNLSWQPIFYTKKPPVFSTLWDLWKIRKKAVQIHKKTPFQLIHCRSYLTALIGLYFKEKYKIKFIFDMRGFWADERIDGKLWNAKNFVFNAIYKFFKRKEKEFIQNADTTISLTENAKTEIQSWESCKNAKIQVIPCCTDLEVFNPTDGLNRNFSEKPFASDFCISYLGSLGTWYLLDEMLLFFKELQRSKPKASFLFITPDSPNLVWEAAERLGINPESLRIQKAERLEVPLLLLKSNISIFFIKDAYSKKASSPTKMGEILAMGIPIIANDIGDHAYIFEKYHCGLLQKDFSVAEMQKNINKIPELLALKPQHLRAVAQDYFSLSKGIELYNSVYQDVTKSV